MTVGVAYSSSVAKLVATSAKYKKKDHKRNENEKKSST